MTRRATGQLAWGTDFVLCDKFLAHLFLICRSCPRHVEYLVSRANVLCWVAMAIQTPLHVQRRILKYQRHFIYRPVTGGAANSFVDMNAVVEVNVVGQPVNFNPFDGLIRAVAFAHRFQVRGIVEQHRVAIHAGFCWRYARIRGIFHAGMTVSAVDSVIAYVVLVAELHGLHSRNALIGDVGRPGNYQNARQRQVDNHHQGENGESCN